MIGDIVRSASTEIGEAVGLAEYDSELRRATLSLVASGPAPLQYGLATGVDMPLHAGAAGKAILAYLPETTVDKLDLQPFTDRTITAKSTLLQQMRDIRARGWAIGDGERIPDAFGIAVPYFIDGAVAGSLTATIPRFRATDIDTVQIAATLASTAQRITRLFSINAHSGR